MRYQNLEAVQSVKGIRDMLKWARERRKKVKDLQAAIPQETSKDSAALRNNRSRLSITWIGHSTFLIQINGLNILTDPVWALRIGTAKRQTEPGLPLSELPEIDAVVISHGHYDHLDFPTIRRIPGNPRFFLPAGLKKAFRLRGYKDCVEASWYDGFVDHGVRFTFVPAQHWTRRTAFDTNSSHWGGWMIEADGEKTIYFAGDTGYFSGFKDIGERFSPDYVLMPIGAYEPEWFMEAAHINPEDAVQAFIETGGKYFIPMHYGAYRLADDTGPEALDRLLSAWKEKNLDEDQLKVLAIGGTVWG